ncbi:MAG: hypothetical protein Q9174_006851, partial [Haloplaca sp. 1 TL-2023]
MVSTAIEPSLDFLIPTSPASVVVSVDSVLSRTELDLLYHQYFKAVDPLAHVIHKPTFDRQFVQILLDVYPSKTSTKSFTALVLAMCFTAAVSLSYSQPQVNFQTDKGSLVEKLKLATERALVAAQHMKSLKLETMQAFAIYLIPQCRGELSRAQSSMVGALVRLAQCAGLHRDPSVTDVSPLECHIRGLLWYQICFLDLHTCEQQGPQPMIHADDFDTPLPMNVDDIAFETSSLPVPSNGWTDVTFSLIRYEITEIHRVIFRERIALDKKTTDLTAVRAKIESSIQNVVSKYLRNLDDSIPIQKCARLTAESLLARCIPMVLQVFLRLEERNDTQEEIQKTILARALDLMEAGATLETATDLIPWAWYAPTYQQYHSIFFVLVMLYMDPDMPDAARASAMIDHVFGTCYGITKQQRCGDIIRMLANECNAFMKLRKVKYMPRASSRTSEASPPNMEAVFENFRQGQQGNQDKTATTGPGSSAVGTGAQSFEDFMASQIGQPNMTMDDWL